jgi:UDP-N-acetylmuramate: L-alanyl-gamma-D-glutamyl-meso-diaminopimelate ligase
LFLVARIGLPIAFIALSLLKIQIMKVHFIAIGGSAMHNLAIALHQKGYQVTGSDDEIFEPSFTRLRQRNLLPDSFGWFPEKISNDLDAVILGMHARADNPELIEAQKKKIKIYSYPEFLYEQSKFKKRIVIGGSHGKTTITSMILHVMKQAGIDVDFMVGAQLEGFEVMVKLSETTEWMIMEGDEYLTSPIDRVPKFLHYHPHIAVISGIGWDHINVFPTFENYLDQFRLFITSIEEGGCLIYFQEDIEVVALANETSIRKMPYIAHPFVTSGGQTTITSSTNLKYGLKIFGSHNMANLNAARLVCKEMGVSEDVFYHAISSFYGASRRLETIAYNGQSILYRDFAHAPSKVKASTAALRLQHPDAKLIVCLELHTYSSLNEIFIDQYKNALDEADIAVVFYDPHAVALKRLPQMTFERISRAFSREDLLVFDNKGRLKDFLIKESRGNFALALMSSGSFNGLDTNQLAIETGLIK